MAQPPHHRPRAAGGLVLCLLLAVGCGHQLSTAPSAARPSTAPPTVPPTSAAAAGAPLPVDGSPAVPVPAAQVAADFVTALNTHDARPGRDHSLHDANGRTRPYVSDQVYAEIADPQTRNSAALWQQLTAASAVTTVHVDKVAVPEGAPPPTAETVEVRITYTVTTTGQTLQNTPIPVAQTLSQAMQVAATPAGWRVNQLLAF